MRDVQINSRVLLLLAVSLVMFCGVAKSDVQDQRVQRREASTPPTTLTDAIKVLMQLEARMIQMESKRAILLRGRDGRDGLPGQPGKDGAYGKDGSPGPQGPSGTKGQQGLQGARGPQGAKSGGVQYVRWGKTTCPSDAILVYKGRIGGGHYTHSGGGSNYLCLTEDPKYGRYKDGHQSQGLMYGTEYQVSTFNPLTNSNLHDHDAPCAVCLAKTRSVKLMTPATYECPAGWMREYQGYLMAEKHSHSHSSEFICVDQDAEPVSGTHSNLDGALLYPVEGACGSLPCLPYIAGRELTCAVCTK